MSFKFASYLPEELQDLQGLCADIPHHADHLINVAQELHKLDAPNSVIQACLLKTHLSTYRHKFIGMEVPLFAERYKLLKDAALLLSVITYVKDAGKRYVNHDFFNGVFNDTSSPLHRIGTTATLPKHLRGYPLLIEVIHQIQWLTKYHPKAFPATHSFSENTKLACLSKCRYILGGVKHKKRSDFNHSAFNGLVPKKTEDKLISKLQELTDKGITTGVAWKKHMRDSTCNPKTHYIELHRQLIY